MQNLDGWEDEEEKKKRDFEDQPNFSKLDFLLADNSGKNQQLPSFDEDDGDSEDFQEIIDGNPEHDDKGYFFDESINVSKDAVKLFDDDKIKGESAIEGRLPKKKPDPMLGPADMTASESKVSQALAKANATEKEFLDTEDSTIEEPQELEKTPQLGSSEDRASKAFEESDLTDISAEGDEPFDWQPFEGNQEFGPQEKREKGKIDWMPWDDDKEFGPQEADGKLSDDQKLSVYERIMAKLNSGDSNDAADWGQIAEQIARSRSVAKGGRGVDVGFYDMLRNRGKSDKKDAIKKYLQGKKDIQAQKDRDYKVGRDDKLDAHRKASLDHLKDKFGKRLETDQGQITDKSNRDWAKFDEDKTQFGRSMALKEKLAEMKKTGAASKNRYDMKPDALGGAHVFDKWEGTSRRVGDDRQEAPPGQEPLRPWKNEAGSSFKLRDKIHQNKPEKEEKAKIAKAKVDKSDEADRLAKEIPGVGQARTEKEAREFRDTVASAMNSINDLEDIKTLGKDITVFDVKKKGLIGQKMMTAIGGLRLSVLGPGVMTDGERAYLKENIGNPAALMSTESIENAKLDQLIEQIKRSLDTRAKVIVENGKRVPFPNRPKQTDKKKDDDWQKENKLDPSIAKKILEMRAKGK